MRRNAIPDDDSLMWRGRIEGKLDTVIVDHERRITQGELVHDTLHGRITDQAVEQATQASEIKRLDADLKRSAGLPTKIIAGVASALAVIATFIGIADRIN